MLYSGIDLHKRSLVIHTLDAGGTTTREAELKSVRSAVLAYFGTLGGPQRRQSVSEYRVLGPTEAGGVQWPVSRTRPDAEAPAVAAAGEPVQSN